LRFDKKLSDVKAWARSFGCSADFGQLEHYCIFVGYPRSGHSLVGSLLDAHPDIVIANEFDALRYVARGGTRERLFPLLLDRSVHFAKGGNVWARGSYAVPNQWNGRTRQLRVIGSKKGGKTARKLREDPTLLSELRDRVQLNLKLVHVTRNPFDNIATMSRREERPLAAAVEKYFRSCEGVRRAREQTEPENWLDLSHEAVIEDPFESLTRLCRFLGQECPEDYLRDSASIVFKKPHNSRTETRWPAKMIHEVNERKRDYPFLEQYSFEGGRGAAV
jgi:hypothetical protein